MLAAAAASPAAGEELFKVNVNRTAPDLYEVIGADIEVRTRLCFNPAENEEAVIVIGQDGLYTTGEMIFIGENAGKCEIADLVRKNLG